MARVSPDRGELQPGDAVTGINLLAWSPPGMVVCRKSRTQQRITRLRSPVRISCAFRVVIMFPGGWGTAKHCARIQGQCAGASCTPRRPEPFESNLRGSSARCVVHPLTVS